MFRPSYTAQASEAKTYFLVEAAGNSTARIKEFLASCTKLSF